jgi:adenine-specific DNA-methyltransferase
MKTEARSFAIETVEGSTGTDAPSLGRFSALDPQKLRGGYYTTSALSRWLCAWAVRTADDAILEPSCGDGSFLESAVDRLIDLGAKPALIARHVVGVEIIADEADKARKRLHKKLGVGANSTVAVTDFFAWWSKPGRQVFDAVVGNPPFIRYQTFPEPHRGRAMHIMKDLGLSPNKLTNIWVPFVASSAACVRPGGRLALVLPAELLQVTYASQLRSFLTDRFGRIDIVACNELFFEKAEQEVILLLADDARAVASDANECRVTLTETKTVESIVSRTPAMVLKGAEPKTVRHSTEKWLKFFLSEAEIGLMRRLRESGVATTLDTFASVDVGVVTGKNEFFVMNKSDADERGLASHLMPLVSRTSHLSGARIDKKEWLRLASEDQLVHLLHLAPRNGAKLTTALARYIKSGEARLMHTGYKCSIREPWYAVPSVWVPDAFLFRQIYDFPRIVFNDANVTSTDTIHRVKVLGGTNPKKLIANLYTYLTAASAEIEGRSYGGGVLELEPTEAERLLVPRTLGAAIPLAECDRLVREGRLDEVLKENNRRVLMDEMGLTQHECKMLRGIWEKMRDRRLARRRPGLRTVA